MRRIAIALMSTISGLVLLFSYHTSLGPEGGGGDGGGTNADGGISLDGAQTAADTPAETPAASSPGASPRASAKGGVSGTFTGDEVQTRWGPVKVQITVRDGKIVKARALKYPNENGNDQQINSWAIPQLDQAVLKAGNARIDSLSGATVTSQGYITSLQSAIDKAHL